MALTLTRWISFKLMHGQTKALTAELRPLEDNSYTDTQTDRAGVGVQSDVTVGSWLSL